jgi:hypothetical protein
MEGPCDKTPEAMRRVRVTVTLDRKLLADRAQLQAAARRVQGACQLHAVDVTLLDFGLLIAEAESASLGKLRGLPEVAAVDLDEERHAI